MMMRADGNGRGIVITGPSKRKYIYGVLFARLAMGFYLISKKV